MIKKSFQYYIDSFAGLSPKVWSLALVSFINRAGTMVVPFLSLYLTKQLSMSLEQVGWIMSSFGLGSVAGSWLGGKLCDKIGYYQTMFGSLVISGLMFFGIMHLTSFYAVCIGIFMLMLVSDAFRPAIFVAIRYYSHPDHRTRSVTLIRLAINLGFSIGPALGGWLIFKVGYAGLFWVDGITCILAAWLLKMTVNGLKSAPSEHHEHHEVVKSPYRDAPFLIFLLATFFVLTAFLQFFSTVPLFYKEIHHLNEKEIGWLLGLNGMMIFLIEMPLIRFCEQRKVKPFRVYYLSTFLFLMSFLLFNITDWKGILIFSMIIMTIGEMLSFPFLNRFTMERAGPKNTGAYMALFSMSFGVSHIVAHNSGLQLVAAFGYEITWGAMCAILTVAILLFAILKSWMDSEKQAVVPSVENPE